jgi:hypothetical protein
MSLSSRLSVAIVIKYLAGKKGGISKVVLGFPKKWGPLSPHLAPKECFLSYSFRVTTFSPRRGCPRVRKFNKKNTILGKNKYFDQPPGGDSLGLKKQ